MACFLGSCITAFTGIVTGKIRKISWAAEIMRPENQSSHGPEEICTL